jgi:hypothetical protein
MFMSIQQRHVRTGTSVPSALQNKHTNRKSNNKSNVFVANTIAVSSIAIGSGHIWGLGAWKHELLL